MWQRYLVFLCAVLACLAKLYCAGSTVGTNDVPMFYLFGAQLDSHGLCGTYKRSTLFNHTPLVAGYAAVLQRLEKEAHQGRKPRLENLCVLPALLRLPGILADFFSVLLLVRLRLFGGQPPWWALVAFALSPVSFMVSGFHGNVDAVMVFLLLVAACMAVENRPLLSGLALGMACNIKVVALLMGPLFLAWWWERGFSVRFLAGAASVILIGWAPAVLEAPREFFANVLGYKGYWGIWGISYWLRQTGLEAFGLAGMSGLSASSQAVMSATKCLIILLTFWLAWRCRKRDGLGLFGTIACVWAVFFVFATGIAPQYSVWLAPFVFVATPRWAVAITGATSMFLVVFYNVITNVSLGGDGLLKGNPWAPPWSHPWNYGHSEHFHIALWGPWATLPWVILIAYLVWLFPKACKQPAPGKNSDSPFSPAHSGSP